MKCVERTPVGYRCRECLGLQRAGYYNATTLDYVVAGLVAVILGGVAGIFGDFFRGTFIFIISIFGGPIAGNIIARVVQFSVGKRRGRYLNWIACGATVAGALLGAGSVFVVSMVLEQGAFNPLVLLALPLGALFSVFNLGFLLFIGLTVFTMFYSLRA